MYSTPAPQTTLASLDAYPSASTFFGNIRSLPWEGLILDERPEW